MLSGNHSKKCLYCGKVVKGRQDKKFCQAACRYNYHNKLLAKSTYSNYMRRINNAIINNRKVLQMLFKDNSSKVPIEVLKQMGFNFKYYTHTKGTKTGSIYKYCYDYGYMDLGNNTYLIVITHKE